jgi:DNA ligase (NAD+)
MLKHAYLYYEADEPVISDYEYDMMLRSVLDYEQAHPKQMVPFSLSQYVGFNHTSLVYGKED